MNTGRGSVAVVGSINLDIVVRADGLPGPGETVIGADSEIHQGGKGANSAVAAARAGALVRFFGAVGADDDGSEALRHLRAEGVDTSAVLRLGDVRTGTAAIVVDRYGENQIAVGAGANGRLSGRQITERLQPYVDSIDVLLLSLEISREAAEAAVAVAEAASVPLILNPAPAGPLASSLAQHATIVTPNATEAFSMTGIEHPGKAASALSEAAGCDVVVTAGKRGAFVSDRHGIQCLVPALDQIHAVDTVGAGDTLNGALAARLAAGDGIFEATRFAVAAAGMATTRRGARQGMPSLADVLRVL